MITLGSLFDGISGFPLAGQRNGMTALWASEIEPFPMKVSSIRFPGMKQMGDITKIDCNSLELVDIVTGGSPCQDLSVAGKRAGLAGERSGLFMEQIRIVRELREIDKRNGRTGINIRPRFMLWENVPGAFSSNKGEDFRAVLEETAKIADETVVIPGPAKRKWNTVGTIMGNGYSIAWRVLDAQYWGVPQRRRRIFLVADFGGQSAPEILFKRQGLSRYSQESGETRQRVAADAERGVRTAGVVSKGNGEAWIMPERHMSLTTSGGQAGQGYPCIITNDTPNKNGPQGNGINEDVSFTLNTQTLFQPTIAMNERQYALTTTEETANTLTGTDYKGTQLIFSIENHPADSRVKLDESGTVQTLTTRMGTGGGNVPMLAVPDKAYSIQGSMIGRADKNGPQGDGINEDVSFTLNTTDRHAVATKVYGICSYASNSMKSSNPHSGIYEAETSRTIDLNGGNPACNQGGMAIVQCIEPGALSRGQGERVWDKCPTLRANMGDNQPCVVFNEETITSKTNASNPKPGDPCHTLGATGAGRTIVLNDQGGSQMDVSENVVGTLRAEMHGNIPAVTTYSFQRSDEFKETDKASTQSRRQYKDATDLVVSPTYALDRASFNQGKNAHSDMLVAGFQGKAGAEASICYGENIAPSLVKTKEAMIAQRYSVRRLTPSDMLVTPYQETVGSLCARDYKGIGNQYVSEDKCIIAPKYSVRRLTPLECERLQGFPDGWTDIPGASDSGRYKALGNSIAVVCAEYVLEGIKKVLEGEDTK